MMFDDGRAGVVRTVSRDGEKSTMALIQASETALNDAIMAINDDRRAGRVSTLERQLEPVLEPGGRLVVPGGRAERQFDNPILGRMAGQWGIGTLRGRVVTQGWASAMGFHGMRWDPGGDPVTISVMKAGAMSPPWQMLDAFVEAAFVRVLAPCALGGGEIVVANLYEPR